MFAKPKRKINRSLLNEIKLLACVCCGSMPCDPDHILSRGAGGDDSQSNVWPLCRNHHHERHFIGLRRLAAKYPAALQWLKRNGHAEVVADAQIIVPGQLSIFPDEN